MLVPNTHHLRIAQDNVGERLSVDAVVPVPAPQSFEVMDGASLVLAYAHVIHI